MATEKHRYAAFEVYPDMEGLRPDWWEHLKGTHGMYARSFHHGEDGGKDHYHVMYCHGNSIRDETLKRACAADGIAANGYIEIVLHPRQYMRYLIHLDDPDKEQFEDGRDHIECVNGFPLDVSRELTPEELKTMKREIFHFVRSLDIMEYCDLLDMLEENELYDHMEYASNKTVLFKGYLDSRRNKAKAVR